MNLAPVPVTLTESAQNKLLAEAFDFFAHTLRASITARELAGRCDFSAQEIPFVKLAVWNLSDLKIFDLIKDRNSENPEIKLTPQAQLALDSNQSIEHLLWHASQRAAKEAQRKQEQQEQAEAPEPIPFAPLLFGGMR